MNGSELIEDLKKKFKVSTDKELAKKLGITPNAIQNWKHRIKITGRQLTGLIFSANRAGGRNMQASALRPLVEFFPIEKRESKQGVNYEVFSVTTKDKSKHPYLEGLKEELQDHTGIYIFFDSRGRAIYVGKARRQKLWDEMKLAFNRERGEVQKIKRVDHPTRKQGYRNSDEKARQIREQTVPLYDLATYFSAYDVDDGLIDEVEAMLVRSFANDLLNKKMERFGRQKNKA